MPNESHRKPATKLWTLGGANRHPNTRPAAWCRDRRSRAAPAGPEALVGALEPELNRRALRVSRLGDDHVGHPRLARPGRSGRLDTATAPCVPRLVELSYYGL